MSSNKKITQAQQYSFTSKYNPSNLGRWFAGKFYSEYKEKADKIIEIDSAMRDIALGKTSQNEASGVSIKEAVDSAETAFNDNRLIDCIYWLAIYRDLLSQIIYASEAAQKEVGELGLDYLARGNEPASTGYLANRQAGILEDAGKWMYKSMFGDPLEKSFKAKIEKIKGVVRPALSACKMSLEKVIEIFDNMGQHRASGTLEKWLDEYSKLNNQKKNVQKIVKALYDNKEIKELIQFAVNKAQQGKANKDQKVEQVADMVEGGDEVSVVAPAPGESKETNSSTPKYEPVKPSSQRFRVASIFPLVIKVANKKDIAKFAGRGLGPRGRVRKELEQWEALRDFLQTVGDSPQVQGKTVTVETKEGLPVATINSENPGQPAEVELSQEIESVIEQTQTDPNDIFGAPVEDFPSIDDLVIFDEDSDWVDTSGAAPLDETEMLTVEEPEIVEPVIEPVPEPVKPEPVIAPVLEKKVELPKKPVQIQQPKEEKLLSSKEFFKAIIDTLVENEDIAVDEDNIDSMADSLESLTKDLLKRKVIDISDEGFRDLSFRMMKLIQDESDDYFKSDTILKNRIREAMKENLDSLKQIMKTLSEVQEAPKPQEVVKKKPKAKSAENNIKQIILKAQHDKFFTSLKKAAELEDPFLMAVMMSNYSKVIEQDDPELSMSLLMKAKEIVDEH